MYFCIYLHPYYFFLFMLTFFWLSLLFYYNISVTCIDRILHNITTNQQQQQYKVSTIYLLMVYFTFYSTFLFCLLYDIIYLFYHWFYLQFLFVTKDFYRIFKNNTRHQQRHQQSIGTIDMMVCCIVSNFHLFLYIYLTAHLLLQNYITVVRLNFTNMVYIYISEVIS